jgi:hypothetical protein
MKRCPICQSDYEDRSQGKRRLTCSSNCRSKLQAQRNKAKRQRFQRQCEICAKPFQTARSNHFSCSKPCAKQRNILRASQRWHDSRRDLPQFKVQQCKWCDQDMKVPSDFRGVFKYHDECKKPARQAQYRVKSIRRQGMKNGTIIGHDRIAERDGFKCYLCEKKVDMTLPRTHRLGATLDHVVPLSKGGADRENNIRLAHWLCNIRKSDLTLEEYRAKSR